MSETSEVRVRVKEESLRKTVAGVLEKLGETPEDAVLGANTLVGADLYGHETHGINSLTHYVGQYQAGNLTPNADWKVVREAPAAATIDGGGGHTIILGAKAMNMAIEKAREVGIGAVTLFNCGHSGAVGQYAFQAVKADMIGLTMSSSIHPSVVPTHGAERRVGTNPIAIAAPARSEVPYQFDAATSVVSGGKLEVLSRRGGKLPAGWLVADDGSPLSGIDIKADMEDLMFVPLGGNEDGGSYKGDAFGMLPEILGSLLSGALPSFADDKVGTKHFFCAFNIAAFTDVDRFKDNADRTLRAILDTKPAPGYDRVVYAGVIEHESMQDAQANGIPLQQEVFDSLSKTATEMGIAAVERF